MGYYCGDQLPTPVITHGNAMLVAFKSDVSIERSGFRATWNAGKCGKCFFITFLARFGLGNLVHMVNFPPSFTREIHFVT